MVRRQPKVAFSPANGLGDKLLDTVGFHVLCKHADLGPILRFNERAARAEWGDNVYDTRLFDFGNSIELGANDEDYRLESPDPSISLCPYNVYVILSRLDPQRVTFEGVSDSFAESAKAIVRPADDISRRLPRGLETAHGIHMRRSDKVRQGGCDPRHENDVAEFRTVVSALLEDVYALILREERPAFFVVSEDARWRSEVEARIRVLAEMAGKTITFARPDYRGVAAFDSVLDMFGLARCADIRQGVKYSSFSTAAALVGNVRLINYAHLLERGDECLIHNWTSVLSINGGPRELDPDVHRRSAASRCGPVSITKRIA